MLLRSDFRSVLPFSPNIGGDAEYQYFVDGVTESLTTDLADSRAIVIARATLPSHSRQGCRREETRLRAECPLCAGRLTCSAAAHAPRINVQLIDAETGNHLWAETFDKPVADLFDMRDEIVARLANALDAELVAAGLGAPSMLRPGRSTWCSRAGPGSTRV